MIRIYFEINSIEIRLGNATADKMQNTDVHITKNEIKRKKRTILSEIQSLNYFKNYLRNYNTIKIDDLE